MCMFGDKEDRDVISLRERRNCLIQWLLVSGLVAIHIFAVIAFARCLTLPYFGTEQDWESASDVTSDS